jgi:hypothetical protein
MSAIRLYTTAACHLCDKAKAIIWPVLEKYELSLEEIDIAETDFLIDRYGTRIPVVAYASVDEELGWPFTEAQLCRYIEAFILP